MTENETPLDMVDLGDAVEETKQISPVMIWPDSWFQWGEYY